MKQLNPEQLKGLRDGYTVVNMLSITLHNGAQMHMTDLYHDIQEFGITYVSSGILTELGNSKSNGSVEPSSFDVNFSGTAPEAIRLLIDPRNLYSQVEHRQGYYNKATGTLSGGSFIVRNGRISEMKYSDKKSPVCGFKVANKWSNLKGKNQVAADNQYWINSRADRELDTFFKEVGRD